MQVFFWSEVDYASVFLIHPNHLSLSTGPQPSKQHKAWLLKSLRTAESGWSWDPDSTNPERATYCFTYRQPQTKHALHFCVSLCLRVPLRPISSFDTRDIYIRQAFWWINPGSVASTGKDGAEAFHGLWALESGKLFWKNREKTTNQKPLPTNSLQLVASLTRSARNTLELTELTELTQFPGTSTPFLLPPGWMGNAWFQEEPYGRSEID